jgi:hypothetical protein
MFRRYTNNAIVESIDIKSVVEFWLEKEKKSKVKLAGLFSTQDSTLLQLVLPSMDAIHIDSHMFQPFETLQQMY